MTTCKGARFIISVDSSVCLSDDNFRKLSHRKFIFAHQVYLQAVQVKFVFEGHRVKVKVTGAENVIKQRQTLSTATIGRLSCDNLEMVQDRR